MNVEKFSAENLTIQNILLGIFTATVPTKVTIKYTIKYTLQEIKYKMEIFLLLGKLFADAKILLGAKNTDRKSTAEKRVQTPRARPMIRDIQDTLLL